MVKRGAASGFTSSMLSTDNNHRSQKTSGRYAKDKLIKGLDKESDLLSTKLSSDVLNTGARTVTSGRGGRGRHTSSRTYLNNVPSIMEAETLLYGSGILQPPIQVLDPTLLTRGMTARYIGSRVSNYIKTLSTEEIEKDLRHMEAYRCAFLSYAKKYFAYINQDLLSRDMLGMLPPTDTTVHLPTSSIPNRSSSAASGPVMPSKIDPEEEKKQSLLRKKILASETKREAIESEYVSYRAHFVYQCHKLLQTRKEVYGQLQLLQEWIRKKGSVLAIQRVMCSILKDLTHGLLQLKNQGSPLCFTDDSDSIMNVEDHQSADVNHLWGTWAHLESQLKNAESALDMIKPPKELVVLKNALALASSSTAAPDTLNGTSRRSRSPSKSKGNKEDDDSTTTSGVAKKKSKELKSNSNLTTQDKGKQTKGHSAEEAIDQKDFGGFASGKRNSLGNDDRCIPWHCLSQPRTPLNVPLLLSLVGESSSKFVAYGVGNILGDSSSSMMWIQNNLPKVVKMSEEESRLKMLRREVEALETELECEIKLNNDLQKEAIANRKRSDMLCSTMCILRTETEAIVERHNIILDTSEVKERALALDNGLLSEDFDEEDDLDEDDEMDDEMGDGFRTTSFDADHADDSDSTGLEDEENEEDEGGYNKAGQDAKKADKKETAKGISANKRTLETYSGGHEERKRRKP